MDRARVNGKAELEYKEGRDEDRTRRGMIAGQEKDRAGVGKDRRVEDRAKKVQGLRAASMTRTV